VGPMLRSARRRIQLLTWNHLGRPCRLQGRD
jgi:hypothetical protein